MSFSGASIAQGASNVLEHDSKRELRDLQTREAQLRQRRAESELQEFEANAPKRQQADDLKMQQLEAQTYQSNTAMIRDQTYNAFRSYDADGNPRHLNNFLRDVKQNPQGASMYGDIVRADKLTPSAENDAMLRKLGIQDLQAIYNDPELNKKYVSATMADGTQQVVDMESMYVSTGYTDYMTDQQLATTEKQARIAQMLRQGQSGANITLKEKLVQQIMKDEGLSMGDAYQRVNDMESKGSMGAEEQAVKQIMQDQPGITYLQAFEQYMNVKNAGKVQGTDQSRFIETYIQENPNASEVEASEAYANRTKTSTQKEIVDVQTLKTDLDNIGFWEGDFLKDISSKDKAYVHGKIAEIEDLRGIKLSTADKRLFRDVRNLTTLGGTAGSKLTPKDTGILDKWLGGVKSYFVDEVGGKIGTSSYESFRNVFRNALYGASLTESEIKAFKDAAGTRSQQLKPVLAQLRTQMVTLKDQLSAVQDTNDPYLAQFYFGGDLDVLDDKIEAIDERLGLIDEVSGEVNGEVGQQQQDIIVSKTALSNATKVKAAEVKTQPLQDGTQPSVTMQDIWDQAVGVNP